MELLTRSYPKLTKIFRFRPPLPKPTVEGETLRTGQHRMSRDELAAKWQVEVETNIEDNNMGFLSMLQELWTIEDASWCFHA